MKENHLRSLLYTFILSGMFLLLTYACGDDNPKLIQERPTLSTSIIENITKTTATSGGAITNDGEAEVTARGICWSTNENPTITDNKTQNGKGTGDFISTLEELLPNTTYFVRAYATNVIGTAYANSVTFKTENGVMDIDGNIYNVVKIGSQTWMKENLRTTRLNDGIPIPLLESNLEWNLLSHSAYCWYDNDKATYGERYGALYKWKTVLTGKLCPEGWHIPTDFEWWVLTYIIGGETLEGVKTVAHKLKAASEWSTPGTDEVGFSAYPAGSRSWGGGFDSNIYSSQWWCGYEDIFKDIGHVRSIFENNDQLESNYDHERNIYGHSVRCIRDEPNELTSGLYNIDKPKDQKSNKK